MAYLVVGYEKRGKIYRQINRVNEEELRSAAPRRVNITTSLVSLHRKIDVENWDDFITVIFLDFLFFIPNQDISSPFFICCFFLSFLDVKAVIEAGS